MKKSYDILLDGMKALIEAVEKGEELEVKIIPKVIKCCDTCQHLNASDEWCNDIQDCFESVSKYSGWQPKDRWKE